MLGSIKENYQVISTAFQPNENTRISGVLFVGSTFDGRQQKTTQMFISNPYAKNPVGKHIEALLKRAEIMMSFR